MDNGPVPFPSLSHYNDEASPERRSSSRIPHGRVKSSPSPVKVWLPAFPQARTRPHLRPLDLAASSPPSTPGPFSAKFIMPNSSPSYLSPSRPSPGRTQTSASGSPSRTAHSSLLTPPLTPSSSFNSASASTVTDTDFDGDVVPSTPPDGGSPLRWSALNLRKSALNGPRRSVDEGMPGYSTIMAELSARLGGVDLTPRLEKPFSFGDHDTGATGAKMDSDEKKPSRFLVVQGVSRSATHSSLRAAFCHGNEVKAIYLRLLPQYGIILLLYFDPRCALRAKGEFSGKTLAELCGTATNDTEDRSPLRAESVCVSQVKKVVGSCDFVEPTDSSLIVEVAGRVVDPGSIQQLFSSIGELVEFRADDSEKKRQKDCQAFFVEYFDLRDAELAVQQLNNRNIFGAYLRIRPSSNIENREPDAQAKDVNLYPELSFPSIANKPSNTFDIDLSSPPLRSAPLREPESPTPKKGMGTDRRPRPRTVSTSAEGMAFPDHLQDMRQRSGQQLPSGSSPSELFYGDFNQLSGGPSFNANQQRGTGMQPGRRGYAGAAQEDDVFGPRAPSQAYGMPYPDAPTPYQFGSYLPYPQYDHGYTAYDELRGYPGNPVQWMPPNISPTDYHHGTLHSGGTSEHSQGRLNTRGRTGYMGDDRNPRQRPSGASFESTASDVDSGSRTVNGDPFATEKGVSEKNQLNISMIESGLDTRTTVMIRNIPNKMSAKDLLAVIDKVCPRRIDFLYLRMDFSNGCNVGYAFVNFITVQDLLLFAKTMLGVKWNMYSSEKALHLSYANYQGKEALVEKFKNSCIMDERSEWRPRIFFSDGPNQGLPEPFPPPTHLRRKERSANNRGALFVPGAHHHHGRYFGERGGLHNGPQRGSFQRDSGARF